MNILYLLVPLALLLSVGFVGAFIWATQKGQWDDLDLAPTKALLDPNTKDVYEHKQQ